MALVILVIGVIIAVVVGNKFKTNSGIICIALAYITGCYIFKSGVMSVITQFPVKIMFLTFSVCYFFGFHTKNGTFDVLAKKLLYKCRNAAWAMPLAIPIITGLVAALGAGTTGAVVTVAPIAYIVAAASGYPSIFAAILINLGSLLGGEAPWSPVGALLKAYATNFYGEEIGSVFVWKVWGSAIVGSLILLAIVYILFKGYKTRKIEMEKPPEFNAEQKRSLTMILIFIVLAVVPTLLKAIFGGPVFTYLAGKLDVQMIAVVMGIACSILKMGNERDIIVHEVPWNIVLLSGGFAMFISVCSGAGAVDALSSVVTDNMSGAVVCAIMAAIGAGISFVADGLNVGFGAFGASFVAIAATTGTPMLSFALAFMMGVSVTAFSPFSMGGALVLSFNHDPESSRKQFNQQIIGAILMAIFVVILAFIGFFNIFA